MAGTTPFRSYPYPTYGDATNFPTQQQAFATAVDTDIDTNLNDAISAELDAPSARASRPSGTQAIANATNVTISYTTEDYDNAGIVNLGGSATNFVIPTAGVYLITGSFNMQPDAAAGGSIALTINSSGATMPIPGGSSRQLDNDKDTSVTATTLHQVVTAPETITMVARHNHGASLNASIAQLTVTRIA